jgi:cephalosporin hydroxylase
MAASDRACLPPRVTPHRSGSLAEYWRARIAQHLYDTYMGVPLLKLPEDLRVYEHLLWLGRPDAVIEIGAHEGGSALWFRDRLRALEGYGGARNPVVVSVDLDCSRARAAVSADPCGIAFVEGDVLDSSLPGRVAAALGGRQRCLVVEDSAHLPETTTAALDGFSTFVPVGGFFVVEDGIVDEEELLPYLEWPRGVQPAIETWLRTPPGQCFRRRSDLEVYGVTAHVGGFLERVSA